MGKLLLIPIAVMTLISILGISGLGGFGTDASHEFIVYDFTTSMDENGDLLYLYDSGGHAVTFWNGTYCGENGWLQNNVYITTQLQYHNVTGNYAVYFPNGEQVMVEDTEGLNFGIYGSRGIETDKMRSYALGGINSWFVVITAVITLGAIAGISIVGIGLTDFSVQLAVKGAFFFAIWSILSLMAYPIILESGFILYLIYFVMGLMYILGVVGTMGVAMDD